MKPIFSLILSCAILLSVVPATHTAGVPSAPHGRDALASTSDAFPRTQDMSLNVRPPTIEPMVNERIEPQGNHDETLAVSSEPSITQFSANNWQIECVDCPKLFGPLNDRSLRLDSNAYPHIAYGGDRLYYAWHDGTQWHYETIDDSSSISSDTSLVLDGADRPHISYHTGNSLKYAWHDGTSWRIGIANSGGEYLYPSLALDGAGRPHISYVDSYELKHVWHDGMSWQTEVVATQRAVMDHTSLVLDESGHPHISYQTCTGTYFSCCYLEHAWHDGTGWQITTIDSGGDVMIYSNSSLALDGADHPHIGYFDLGGIKYAWYDGMSWRTEIVDEWQGCALVSLALDGADRPHIGIGYNYSYGIKYAWHDGTQWFSDTVDNSSPGYPSLAVDVSGLPQISYHADNSLKHIRYDGIDWQTETVDIEENVGYGVSLALDASTGQPRISYHDRTHWDLKYTWYDGTDWRVETVDEGDVVEPTSLVVDEAGRPHISYSEGEYDDLKYAWYDGAAWHNELASSEGRALSKSLALDSLGRPHIAYTASAFSLELKYVWYDGTSWQVETIEGHNVGIISNSALALDAEGRPHISYQGGYPDYALKYAWHDGVRWYTETVGSVEIGIHASLALDETDRPHISYYDDYNGDLKYAYYDGTQWHIETVADSVEDEDREAWLTLKLDASGRPHISYYDSSNGDLKYAWRDGVTWHIEVVDSKVSGYASLALDDLGLPHIAYYDSANGDLKYARLISPPPMVWKRVNASGFGNSANEDISALEMFNGQLYAGASNWMDGGQIWRTVDAVTWTPVISAGFGSAYTNANAVIFDMIEFDGQLYAGTGDWWDNGTPGQIWRSSNGTDWTLVTGDGFGNANNIGIVNFGVFSYTLYAITYNPTDGLEIWRSATGDSGDWSRVVADGNGSADNTISTGLIEFDGHFYAAIENAHDGAEIWCTSDGVTWTAVISGGFGDVDNTQTGSLAVFDDCLYVGTRNDATGAQLWRFRDGTAGWLPVIRNGFQNSYNIKIESLVVFDEALYASTSNRITGMEVWRLSNDMTWRQVNLDGFGNSNNVKTLWSVATVVFDDNLCIGTNNSTDGGEIWCSVSLEPQVLLPLLLHSG